MSVRRMYSWEVMELLPLLHQFNEESGYGYEMDDGEIVAWWATAILTGQGAVFVQIKDGRLVGALGGQIAAFPGSKALRAQEAFFYVEPEHRGSIASARMLKDYIAWSKERGVSKCQIVGLCSTGNEGKVRKFYEAMGFTLVEMGFEIRNSLEPLNL